MEIHLDQIYTRLVSLIRVSQLPASVANPEELINTILDSALRVFAAEGGAIAQVDDDEQYLRFVTARGGGAAAVDEFRLRLGQGLIGWVAQTGQGVVCNDVSQDPRFFRAIDLRSGFRTQSILCAPLQYEGRLLGSIEVLNTTDPAGFTAEDMEFLLALAGLAAPVLQRMKQFAMVRDASAALQQLVLTRHRFIRGPSVAMQEVLHLARSVAATNTTVLLLGESGTGKEVVARAIHDWSPRAGQPFVAVNCTTLTPELLESELFGHEKGSFTGAIGQKKGKFELAEGGTIFLDEIGDLAPPLQAKLLRVLQEKEFQRVGGVRDIHANVRILAATNRDLRRAMQSGTFREDLYYRLNVVSVTLPPLRDRKEDLPEFVNHFLALYSHEFKRAPLGIAPAALECLQSYSWPGNVRELQNTIERAVVLSRGPHITPADLPPEVRCRPHSRDGALLEHQELDKKLPLAEATEAFQRACIRQALTATAGNQTEAAKELGLSQSDLSRRMKRLGLR
jgi:transcriptional regulator with GAF, ATPase, and Fis domain